MPNWYHFACFWKRARVSDTTDIHGLDAMRWEDQEKVKKHIAGESLWLSYVFEKWHTVLNSYT